MVARKAVGSAARWFGPIGIGVSLVLLYPEAKQLAEQIVAGVGDWWNTPAAPPFAAPPFTVPSIKITLPVVEIKPWIGLLKPFEGKKILTDPRDIAKWALTSGAKAPFWKLSPKLNEMLRQRGEEKAIEVLAAAYVLNGKIGRTASEPLEPMIIEGLLKAQDQGRLNQAVAVLAGIILKAVVPDSERSDEELLEEGLGAMRDHQERRADNPGALGRAREIERELRRRGWDFPPGGPPTPPPGGPVIPRP